jgi:peptidoglycan/LPS O-acetylase OafA/YrhL
MRQEKANGFTVAEGVIRTRATTNASPSTSSAAETGVRQQRAVGLDSIRFSCALVVMLGHLGFLTEHLNGNKQIGLTKLATGLYNSLFNGPAAVIVFFIVSGFCIHFPYSGKRALAPLSFYSRRLIRILPPAVVFILIGKYIIRARSNPQDSVLWSIVCETIYYILYPLLLSFRRRYNWSSLISIVTVMAGILIATHLNALSVGANGYIALGWRFTWIVGLPCWLLGCWLAENYTAFPIPTTTSIWQMRAAIYILTIFLQLVRFHVTSPIASNCILLDMFAVPACVWVGFEIAYATQHPRIYALEWAGAWSYSLYLVHPLVGPILAVAGWSFIAQKPQTHFLLLIISLFASHGFFLLVEQPFHHLAVAAGRAAEAKSRKSGVSLTLIAG